MPRLGSKKSRNGCLTCKARRVKCDEKRPCSNCVKHSTTCSLLHSSLISRSMGIPEAASISSWETGSASPSGRICTSEPPAHSEIPGDCTAYDGTASREGAENWMRDLELMHHYTAYASRTIPGNAQAQLVWTDKVPQEAFSHGFLMHCILAFSAYHLAHLNPSSAHSYSLLASNHHAAAIRDMRAVLPSLNNTNYHAVFATASLITLNAFAEFQPADSSAADSLIKPAQRSIDALANISHLLRGMDVIIQSTEPLIYTGPFAAIFHDVPSPLKPPILAKLLTELESDSYRATIASSRLATTASYQLHEVIKFCIKCSPHPMLRVVMLWLIRTEQEFFDAVANGTDPATRVVLDKYYGLVRYTASRWWFLETWSVTS